MKIAYQGIPGSFTHIAAQKYFGAQHHFLGSKSFNDIFEAVKNKKANYGVIPVENSLAGSVYENYDLLNLYDVHVTGEIYLKIEHHLLGADTQNNQSTPKIDLIEKVYSHPKAHEQCANFFDQYPWIEKIAYSDTARAAEYVSSQKNRSLAAIASRQAARLYKLKVFKKNIEDNSQNYTRFLIIAKTKSHQSNVNKCSLILSLPHVPGSLQKVLKIIADYGLNLTKIESRPIQGLPFEYIFYLDFEFNSLPLEKVEKVIEQLKLKTQFLKVLGLYKHATA